MPNIYISTHDLFDDVSDEELIDEIRRRGLDNSSGLDLNTEGVDADKMRELLEQIWIRRRQGQDYQDQLDKFIYMGLGKIV